MGRVEVQQGTIYNPGWQVVEQLSEHHWRCLATFERKADANEFWAAVTRD